MRTVIAVRPLLGHPVASASLGPRAQIQAIYEDDTVCRR